MILVAIIVIFLFVGYFAFKTETPVHLDGNNQPITSQDSIEDVVTDENTLHVKVHEKDRIKEEKIEAATVTTEDFIPVEEELKGVRVLSDHIAKVIELNPNSKKRLTKRERNTVDKIVKEKKK